MINEEERSSPLDNQNARDLTRTRKRLMALLLFQMVFWLGILVATLIKFVQNRKQHIDCFAGIDWLHYFLLPSILSILLTAFGLMVAYTHWRIGLFAFAWIGAIQFVGAYIQSISNIIRLFANNHSFDHEVGNLLKFAVIYSIILFFCYAAVAIVILFTFKYAFKMGTLMKKQTVKINVQI